MNETPFEQFIALVQLDQEINSLQASLNRLDSQNATLAQESDSYQKVVETAQASVHHARKEVDEQELEMKSLDMQEGEKKAKLDRVTSSKEYQALKADIDQLKMAQHEREETLIAAWNTFEQANKELETVSAQITQKKADITQKIENNNQQKEAIAQQLDTALALRTDKDKNIPDEWMQKYAVMRSRVSDPVVPVINGHCSSCFYQISLQDLHSLKRRKLVQCKDCFRLLYLPDAQSTSEES